jgi:predicted permease
LSFNTSVHDGLFVALMDIVVGVVEGVLGAALVASCGAVLKKLAIVDKPGINALSKMIFYLFNPAFAFHSIGSVQREVLLRGLWVVFGALASLTISLLLGLLLLLFWPSTNLKPSTKVQGDMP